MDLIDHNEITPAVNQIETHPFSVRAERMRESIDVFDFELTDHRDPEWVSRLGSVRVD